MSFQDLYQKALAHRKSFTLVHSAALLLAWDQETGMPVKAGIHRAETMGELSKISHGLSTQTFYGDFLAELWENRDQGSEDQQACIREMYREFKRHSKLPARLVEEMTKTTSLSQQAWAEARQKSDSSIFLPWLEKVVGLSKQAGECLKENGQSAYEALLDEYEPGARLSDLEDLFENLTAEIVPLLRKIEGRPVPQVTFLQENWDLTQQRNWSEFLLIQMGFDMERGRLDVSEHPFTEGVHSSDVRLTTRYQEKAFFDSMFSTVHEGGHGLYEQGFLEKHSYTPLAEAISLGVHESQSRLWENQVARGKDFWQWAYPQLKKYFPQILNSISAAEFMKAVNKVQPGEIRVDADEVTYNLHIALRFRIETELFNQGLVVGDIEARWNELSDQYLGILPKSPLSGFMQDVHWSVGLFGYFPTYTLGNLMSAQLFNTYQNQIPTYREDFQSGEFVGLKDWLNQNVHQFGKKYSATDLLVKVTGEPLQAKYFTDYLKEKYNGVYQLR